MGEREEGDVIRPVLTLDAALTVDEAVAALEGYADEVDVVVRRRELDTTYYYTMPRAEMLGRIAGHDGTEVLRDALGLHETGRSPPSDCPATSPANPGWSSTVPRSSASRFPARVRDPPEAGSSPSHPPPAASPADGGDDDDLITYPGSGSPRPGRTRRSLRSRHRAFNGGNRYPWDRSTSTDHGR